MPVLVVAGQRDELAGDPEALALAFPHGHGVTLPGCDHFSAIPHALTKAAVFDFLDGLLDEDFPSL
jgi:pimeloyl-ACP methyl ester carboxylesterase